MSTKAGVLTMEAWKMSRSASVKQGNIWVVASKQDYYTLLIAPQILTSDAPFSPGINKMFTTFEIEIFDKISRI